MNIYFVGIGGSGLSPLAELAIDCNYSVYGSDLVEGLGTQQIEKRGVEIDYNQDGKSLEKKIKTNGIDWIVYTAALKENHPELLIAKKYAIKLSKRDGFINHILKEKNLKLIAVSGTHGKTSTTAMLVWAFKKLKLPISYLIGSQIGFGNSSEYNIGSEYFILEADEFDRNFLKYKPDISIITNIDYDHPDIYKTAKEYDQAFSEFTNLTRGPVVLWRQDNEKINYNRGDCFSKLEPDVNKMIEAINLPGKHNRENTFLALKTMEKVTDIDSNKLVEVLSTFPGTTRRMEKIAKNIYSDYAHHPTEIAATIQMGLEVNPKIIVIYQPHQNTRQHEIMELYSSCFENATKVYWLPTHLSRENSDLDILTPEELSANVNSSVDVEIPRLDEDLRRKIIAHKEDGSLIIFMGAGSIDSWVRENF